jgi:hypothetical protein
VKAIFSFHKRVQFINKTKVQWTARDGVGYKEQLDAF